ncbi:hypothetical protein ACU686_45320 [Yinghuangia aomiensis]
MVTQADAVQDALAVAGAAVPPHWRRGTVERGDLDRFPVRRARRRGRRRPGRPGRQRPSTSTASRSSACTPTRAAACSSPTAPARGLRTAVPARSRPVRHRCELRTMAEARTDDGRTLTALNEIYLGHPTHQTAPLPPRHAPTNAANGEASSGLLVGTGTGATGWCGSVHSATAPGAPALPGARPTTGCPGSSARHGPPRRPGPR